MFTDLINELCKDESEKLSVFDRNGPYLATKKIGNIPMLRPQQIHIHKEMAIEVFGAIMETNAEPARRYQDEMIAIILFQLWCEITIGFCKMSGQK